MKSYVDNPAKAGFFSGIKKEIINMGKENEINTEVKDKLTIKRVSDKCEIERIHKLMSDEFMSNGGNLKDLTKEELEEIAKKKGELWAAIINGGIVAAYTLIPISGNEKTWWYINHGVLEKEYRHQGIMEKLHRVRLCKKNTDNYIVISVVRRIFENLGFKQIEPDKLESVDNVLAEIIIGKLRPNIKSYIYIKAENNVE